MMQYPYYPYQIQNAQPQQAQNGIVTLHSEDEALRYPVAPGNSMTFKIEGQPIVIEKTMGLSQLDSPRIERFRLVKEDAPDIKPTEYALAEDVKRLESELEELRASLTKRTARKKGEGDDE